MDLSEEDLLGRPVQGAPDLDPALKSTQLAVGMATRMAALKVGEQGLGFQAVHGGYRGQSVPLIGIINMFLYLKKL